MVEYELTRPDGLTDYRWQQYIKRAMKTLRALTPVRTGDLQAGWDIGDETPNGVMFVNEVPYAQFVNDGTPRMGAVNMTGRMQALMDTGGRLTMRRLAGF
jgi:hypothetical protein